MEGKLTGESASFPFIVKAVDGLGYKKIEYKDINQVLDDVEIELEKDYNEKKDISTVLEEMGFKSNRIFLDTRILKLIDLYRYYNSAATPPAPYTHQMWLDTVSIMETWTPKRIM